MKLRIGGSAPKAVAVVLPVLEGSPLPSGFEAAADAEGFTGAAGTACHILTAMRPTLLVGLGPKPNEAAYHAAGALAAARLARTRRIALDAHGLLPQPAAAFALGAMMRAWRQDQWRSRPDEDGQRLATIDLLNDRPGITAAWQEAEAVWKGTRLVRDLVASPSNLLTPDDFIERLTPLREAGVSVTVLKRRELEHEGLGALLAVGRASAHRPRLVVLRWEGAMEAAPVAFVGKGITFDTGGICIKPAAGMEEMRADMTGAATCAGVMLTLALRRSPAPAVAVLALAENAIGADAYRPGDVLHSHSGQTIEVIDTDAEGRLVLADALSWTAKRLRPQAMIDLATLTGSIITALGHQMAGLFATDDALAAQIAAAGEAVGELVWRMPLGGGYDEALKSDIADLRNCATGRFQPDACHGASFLAHFTAGVPWAHLDIAGMDSQAEASDSHAKGASGYGVRLLDRLVARRFEDPHRA